MINKKCQESSDSYTFDEAISETGYGRFHYKICAACALSILCVGFQNGLSSYVFSAAQCDLDISSQDLGLLNVSFLLGGTISAFLWGMIADVNGRKRVLVVTLILDAAVTLLSSFMNTFAGIIACRFLNGVLIGCPGSVTFTYLAEFHAPRQRAKSVCFSGVAFIAAWVLLPILSFFILPLEFESYLLNVRYTSWRLFLVVIAVPEIIAGLWLQQFPESPRFLSEKNYGDQALKVLSNMYCQNTKKDSSSFLVEKLVVEASNEAGDVLSKTQNKIVQFFGGMLAQTKKLFASDIRKKTFLSCSLMFCNMFGYFGLGLWLPEFFIQFEEHYQLHPNTSITLSELTFSKNETIDADCFFAFDANTFRNTLIVAASAMLCNVMVGWLAGKVSVKNLALATMVFGGASAFSIYYVHSSLGILAVSSVFQAAMATGNMVIGGIVVEQFPTSVSAIALSMAICIGRTGAIINNLLFSTLLGKHNGVIIFVVTGVLVLGSVLCLLVPSQKKDQDERFVNNAVVLTNVAIISKGECNNVTVQNN